MNICPFMPPNTHKMAIVGYRDHRLSDVALPYVSFGGQLWLFMVDRTDSLDR